MQDKSLPQAQNEFFHGLQHLLRDFSEQDLIRLQILVTLELQERHIPESEAPEAI